MMNAVPSLRRRRSVRGFTLVELLTVIAIIGILATILIPAVGGVRKKAGMTKSSSNLRQVGLSYQAFSEAGTRKLNITNQGGEDSSWSATGRYANSPAEWAQVLAARAGLNDTSVFIIDIDSRVGSTANIPRQILRQNAEGSTTVDPDWTTLATTNQALGYEFVVNAATNAPSSTTPLAWTRGLQTTGQWNDDSNPWGAREGGHILFLDGHVEYHQDLIGDNATPGVLVNSSGAPTVNIEDAIDPTNATVKPAVLRYSTGG